MSLYFWVAVASALVALVIGLILRARVRHEQVWEGLMEPHPSLKADPSELVRKTDSAKRPDIPIDSRQRSNSYGEEMNTSETQTPPTSREADLRRSSRIDHSVPLVVLATNRRGETFQERTSALAVNLHGCRYSSRHDYVADGWVTLQVTGTDGAASRAVRARVRSVHAPQSNRELCQVGVELETPGNVWGVPVPPGDWQSPLATNASTAPVAAAVAPARDLSSSLAPFLERQPPPTERRAEVTVFPGPQPAASAAAEPSPAKDFSPSNVERAVVTAEHILQALQGKLQFAAEKAVQDSLSSQLDVAVRTALAKIEEDWKANVRQTEEFSAARLAEVQNLWEKELAVYRSRAEEVSRRLEAVAANSQQALAESQKFLERFANEIAPQLHARLSDSFGRATSEFEARAAEVSARHLAQLSERTQLAARQAHSQLDERIAEAHSLLSTAGGGASQERVESLLNSFRAETFNRLEERLGELYRGFEQRLDSARNRSEEIARQLDTLAAETRQARAQQEQGLAEIRSLLANTNAGVSQERFDSLLNSSREQVLSHLEWRLGEVSGRYEQLLGQVRDRADEVARQIEMLSTETRDHLAETKSLAEHASSKLQSLEPSAIEQSATRAAKDFETAAARVFDRELVRLVQEKQAVSREVSLEFEARASEARALLQKAANGTLEEFRQRVETQIDLILAEAIERLNSSLTTLDAESRAACEARHRTLEADVARAAEQSTLEFRSGIKAFLYSCLVAAVSAVDQHAQTTLADLSTDPATTPRALDASSPQPGNSASHDDNSSSH